MTKKLSTKQKERKAALKSLRSFIRGESKYDQKILRKMAKLIESRHNSEAYKLYRRMDTFVREGLPQDVLDYIMLNRAVGKRVIKARVKLKGKGGKKVFNKEMGPGVIYSCELHFPGDCGDNEIARSLAGMEDDILKEIVEVQVQEYKREKSK